MQDYIYFSQSFNFAFDIYKNVSKAKPKQHVLSMNREKWKLWVRNSWGWLGFFNLIRSFWYHSNVTERNPWDLLFLHDLFNIYINTLKKEKKTIQFTIQQQYKTYTILEPTLKQFILRLHSSAACIYTYNL